MGAHILISFPGEVWFLDPVSPLALEHGLFHDFILTVARAILLIVAAIIGGSLRRGLINSNLYQNHFLEAVWTVFPAIILFRLAVPSLTLLYMVEDFGLAQFSVVAKGHQWFWGYDHLSPEMSSMVRAQTRAGKMGLGGGGVGLLWGNQGLRSPVIPAFSSCGVMVTSTDVLHS